MTKISWLLVDIGDVLLLKNEDTHFVELLANELGVDASLAEKINRAHYEIMDVRDVPQQEFVELLAKNLGYTAPADIYTRFEKAYEKRVRPNNSLQTFLDEVRASGVYTAILSNTIAIYSGVQQRMGISKEAGFDPIVYSWEVGKIKPDADLFTHALKKLNAEPGEVLFIDDKAQYIDAAKQLGMQAILFKDTTSAIASVRQVLNMPVNGEVTYETIPNRKDYLFRVSLKSVIFNESGEVLVVKESGRDWWDIPGGGIDHGESIKEAIGRELTEEVSMQGAFEYQAILAEDPRYMPGHNLFQMRLTFLVKPSVMEFSSGEDGDEIMFIDPEEFKNSPLINEQKIYEYAQIAKKLQ